MGIIMEIPYKERQSQKYFDSTLDKLTLLLYFVRRTMRPLKHHNSQHIFMALQYIIFLPYICYIGFFCSMA